MLMVDDNRHDLEMGELAFAEIGVEVRFAGLDSGEAAVERLRALAADPGAELPALVLLDLNIPRIPGTEILTLMKGDPRLGRVPVVVLTTSNADVDRTRCLALGADEYTVKPHRLDAYLRLFGSFRRYLGDGGSGGPGGPGGQGRPAGGGPGTAPAGGTEAPRLARWRHAWDVRHLVLASRSALAARWLPPGPPRVAGR